VQYLQQSPATGPACDGWHGNTHNVTTGCIGSKPSRGSATITYAGRCRRREQDVAARGLQTGDKVTKSERLIFLINALAQGRTVVVNKLARECNVATRTIYRDLETLMQMDYPIVFRNNGYRLDGHARPVSRQLTPDELNLLLYCMKHNPLAADPFFSDTFRVILQSVDTLRGDGNSLVPRLFVIDPSYRADGLDGVIHKRIATFARAAFQRYKINLRLRSGRSLTDCAPLIVRFEEDQISFVVACLPDWEREEVRVDQVKKIELSKKKFRRRPSEIIRAQRNE